VDLEERRERYVRAALERAEALIRGAAQGERNATLNVQAFGLGHLAPILPRGEAEAALVAAAEAAGLGGKEARRTFKSGWGKGAAAPKVPSELQPGARRAAHTRRPARRNGRPRPARRAVPPAPAWRLAWEGGRPAPVAALDPEGLAERAAIVGESLAYEAQAAGRFESQAEALEWSWAEADRRVCQRGGREPDLVRSLAVPQGAPGWPSGSLASLALDATGPPVGLRGCAVTETPEGEQAAALSPWGTAPGLLADPEWGAPLLRGAPSAVLRRVLLAGSLAEWARLAERAAREGARLAVIGVCPGDAAALTAAAARWPSDLTLAAPATCVASVNAALAPLGRKAREVTL